MIYQVSRRRAEGKGQPEAYNTKPPFVVDVRAPFVVDVRRPSDAPMESIHENIGHRLVTLWVKAPHCS